MLTHDRVLHDRRRPRAGPIARRVSPSLRWWRRVGTRIEATPLWLMQGMGQRHCSPRTSAAGSTTAIGSTPTTMSKQTDTARSFAWRSMTGYWRPRHHHPSRINDLSDRAADGCATGPGRSRSVHRVDGDHAQRLRPTRRSRHVPTDESMGTLRPAVHDPARPRFPRRLEETMLDSDISTAASLAHLHQPETDAHALDRRRFLQLIGMGVGAGVVTGGTGSLLLESLIFGHDPSAWAAGPVGPTDGSPGRDRDVRRQRRPQHRDSVQRRQLLHDAREPADSRRSDAAIDNNVGLDFGADRVQADVDTGELAIVDSIGFQIPICSTWTRWRWTAAPMRSRRRAGWAVGSMAISVVPESTRRLGLGCSVYTHVVGQAARGHRGTSSGRRSGRQLPTGTAAVRGDCRVLQSGSEGQWLEAVSEAFMETNSTSPRFLATIIPDSDQLPVRTSSPGWRSRAHLINANLGFRVMTAGYGDFDSHRGPAHQHRSADGAS